MRIVRTVEQVVGSETRQLETESKILQGVFDGPIYDFIAQVMLFANGEVHQRRRQPVARTFAFKLMEAMRPKAAAIAAELIQERLGKGPFDYVQEFAAQIPARIIADILGIQRSDLPVFMQWDRCHRLHDVARRPQREETSSPSTPMSTSCWPIAAPSRAVISCLTTLPRRPHRAT
jgi:cytochrome P450